MHMHKDKCSFGLLTSLIQKDLLNHFPKLNMYKHQLPEIFPDKQTCTHIVVMCTAHACTERQIQTKKMTNFNFINQSRQRPTPRMAILNKDDDVTVLSAPPSSVEQREHVLDSVPSAFECCSNCAAQLEQPNRTHECTRCASR